MRLRTVMLLVLPVALGSVVVATAGAQTTPAIRAKQAEAARVIHEIAVIDEQLNTTSERYDGARYHLAILRTELHTEQRSLERARRQYRTAQVRVAKLLVTLYESGRPSPLEAILGARSISEMLTLTDAEAAIGRADDAVASDALQARQRVEERVRALRASRAKAAAAVKEIAQERKQILQGLAQRRTLLATVQAQVSRLQAQEQARQARLAAIARARLEAEARARAKQEALAAARARAAAAAQARATAAAKARAAAAARATAAAQAAQTTTTDPAVSTAPLATSPTPAAPPTDTTTTTEPAATPPETALPAPALPLVPPTTAPTVLPAGHPEAASIALGYLGVPYAWGGGTPAGFDCSGLVSYVYAQLGIQLPHFAAAQWTFGVAVPADQLQAGDLVFFDGLNHVGIYLGSNQFIDAPHTGSFVRIDSLTDHWYASHYVGARRI